jgi:hypothetical protein
MSADRLVSVGELSRGMKRLTDGGRRVGDANETAAILVAKHPTTGGICDALAARLKTVISRSTDAIDMKEDNVRWALSHAPRGVAPGPFGWTLEMWKDIAKDCDSFDNLLVFMNKGLCGRVPPERLHHLWGSCNNMALTKPTEPSAAPSHRPISMGETLRRITGKATIRQEKDNITEYLEPLQYGNKLTDGPGDAHRHPPSGLALPSPCWPAEASPTPWAAPCYAKAQLRASRGTTVSTQS